MEKYPNIIVKDILPEDFDHGGTRDEGIRMSDADVIVCMTQDAVPADENLIAELTEKLGEDGIAAAYARQLPGRTVTYWKGIPEDLIILRRAW